MQEDPGFNGEKAIPGEKEDRCLTVSCVLCSTNGPSDKIYFWKKLILGETPNLITSQ